MVCFCQARNSKGAQTAFHDETNSAASKPPDIVSPTSMSTTDELVSHQHLDTAVACIPVVCSSAEPPTSFSIAERHAAEPAETTAPVFTSGGVRPRLEVKNDLSNMFKSLSAKMKMKRHRHSRFSNITGDGLESVSPSSAAAITDIVRVPAKSFHLMSAGVEGTSSADEDPVDDDTDSTSLQPSSHVMLNIPLPVNNKTVVSAVNFQNYTELKATGSSSLSLLLPAQHSSSVTTSYAVSTPIGW